MNKGCVSEICTFDTSIHLILIKEPLHHSLGNVLAARARDGSYALLFLQDKSQGLIRKKQIIAESELMVCTCNFFIHTGTII